MALTQVGENSDVSRINLLVARYYNRGVANFFFYAPDSLFATSLPDIKQIVTSFTVGSPPAAETKPVKVAEDLEKRQKGNGSNQTVLFGGLGAVLVILIIVLAARKKRAA